MSPCIPMISIKGLEEKASPLRCIARFALNAGRSCQTARKQKTAVRELLLKCVQVPSVQSQHHRSDAEKG